MSKLDEEIILGRNELQIRPHTDAESRRDRPLQDIITDIRKLPSLSRFLQPPPTHGSPGSNCWWTSHRGKCQPVHLPCACTPIRRRYCSCPSPHYSCPRLPAINGTSFSDVSCQIQRHDDDVVFPIVKILQESCPPQSRIWWCPTAEFSRFPLHAAGSYRKGQLNLSDLYISSYTPTLAALVRSRRRGSSDPSMEQHRFLLVGQPRAPGQKELASVNSEPFGISRIRSVSTVTCIRDQDANVAKVAEELNKNNFVHFACLGILDRKCPLESGFALGDGTLTVEDMMRYNLQNAHFAYLSASHTIIGDEASSGEVVHLAAAIQLAGFRSAIGTMWAADDAYPMAIASTFHENMVDESGRLDHTRAARALRRSLCSTDIPFDQRILYLHVGA